MHDECASQEDGDGVIRTAGAQLKFFVCFWFAAVPCMAWSADTMNVWGNLDDCATPADLRCASRCIADACAWACSWSSETSTTPQFTARCNGWGPMIATSGVVIHMVGSKDRNWWTNSSATEAAVWTEAEKASLIASLEKEATAVERALDAAGFEARHACSAGGCAAWGPASDIERLGAVARKFGWSVESEPGIPGVESSSAAAVIAPSPSGASELWAAARAGASADPLTKK